jgi:hypothetical protein
MGCFDDDAFSSAQLSQPALLLLSASGNPQALWSLNRPSPTPVAHRQLRTPSRTRTRKGEEIIHPRVLAASGSAGKSAWGAWRLQAVVAARGPGASVCTVQR